MRLANEADPEGRRDRSQLQERLRPTGTAASVILEERRRNVLVAGAGLAGLSAAYELTRREVRVTVLEARDRVGGRVWSVMLSNGEVAELGGEWIEPEYRALPALADELGIDLVDAGIDYRRRDAFGPMAATPQEQEAFVRTAAAARSALDDEAAGSMTLGGFIDGLPGNDRQRATLRARLQGTFAHDLGLIALRPCSARGTFGDHSSVYRRAARGNQSVPLALADQLPDVRLGHLVRRVVVDRDGVRVAGEGPNGPFELGAQALILALPAPVAADTLFDPDLPADLRTAMDELPMGVASKLAVATRERPSLRARQNVEAPFWCYAALGEDGSPRKVITSFAGSPDAQRRLRTVQADSSPWFEIVRGMNPDLTFEGQPVMKAWAVDEFAGGAYSAFDNPSVDRAPVLQRPLGRIAMAGEHTAGDWSGTMEGAVRSGQRAARQVAEILL